MSTAELMRGIASPLRTRRSNASFDGRVFVGSIPTFLYIVRTAADSAGGEMRTLASASASSGSSACSCSTTVAPVHQITPGRTIDASSGASEAADATGTRYFANRLKKLSWFHCGRVGRFATSATSAR